jgi:hypothetical protein
VLTGLKTVNSAGQIFVILISFIARYIHQFAHIFHQVKVMSQEKGNQK